MMSSTSNDEVRRKMEKPVVDIALAIEVCGRVFFPTTPASDSLHIVECEPLESYDDCNFAIRVSAPPNTWYTLKFHNGVESDNLPFLTAQDNLLKDLDPYLRAHELQVPQPQGQTSSIHLIPNVPMSGGVPRSCAVRLLTWIHGSPLYRRKPQLAPEKEGLGKRRGVRNEEDNDENHDEGAPPLQGQDDDPIHLEAGRCLAVLSQSLDQISRRKTETRFEAFHRHHEWDLTNFLEIRPMIQYVQEAWVIEQVLAEFEATIDYTTVRHRICQSDFNDGNLICSADERDKIAGIIDFGDTVYTATVNEIAIALAYMMLTCVHAPIRAASSVLKGFYTLEVLEEPEWQMLYTLICARLAMSITLGAYSYHQNPENKYLLLHAQPAWKVLKDLRSMSREVVLKTFKSAVGLQ